MKNGGGHFTPKLGGILNWNWMVNMTGICSKVYQISIIKTKMRDLF
jgi:hypothetical protein